jgi:hypothetical protein
MIYSILTAGNSTVPENSIPVVKGVRDKPAAR